MEFPSQTPFLPEGRKCNLRQFQVNSVISGRSQGELDFLPSSCHSGPCRPPGWPVAGMCPRDTRWTVSRLVLGWGPFLPQCVRVSSSSPGFRFVLLLCVWGTGEARSLPPPLPLFPLCSSSCSSSSSSLVLLFFSSSHPLHLFPPPPSSSSASVFFLPLLPPPSFSSLPSPVASCKSLCSTMQKPRI